MGDGIVMLWEDRGRRDERRGIRRGLIRRSRILWVNNGEIGGCGWRQSGSVWV